MADWRLRSYLRRYDKLDPSVQRIVDGAWELYKRDKSLVNFEQKGRANEVAHYGARLNDNWRALAYIDGEDILWYWVGAHVDYERMLKSLSK